MRIIHYDAWYYNADTTESGLDDMCRMAVGVREEDISRYSLLTAISVRQLSLTGQECHNSRHKPEIRFHYTGGLPPTQGNIEVIQYVVM